MIPFIFDDEDEPRVSKKTLEDKIAELERKLSQLDQVKANKPKPPPPPPKSSDIYDADLGKFVTIHYDRIGRKRGTMPKGFGTLSPFYLMTTTSKKQAKKRVKLGLCVTCKQKISVQSYNSDFQFICDGCAKDVKPTEADYIKKKFTVWGLYNQPLLKRVLLKLKLAEVKK